MLFYVHFVHVKVEEWNSKNTFSCIHSNYNFTTAIIPEEKTGTQVLRKKRKKMPPYYGHPLQRLYT